MEGFARFLAVSACLCSNAVAQAPAIAAGGVFNVASYTPSSLPGGGIAQGSLMVIFGSGMGPSALVPATALPLSATLGGTSLAVTVNGTTTKPFLVYTSATQISAVLPSNTPVGSGTITVTYNGQTSAPQPISVVAATVGIFATNQAGSGAGIITNTSYAVNSANAPAKAGDVNIIWATGLGPVGTAGSEAAGTAPISSLPSTFKVYVGGQMATVVGAARSSSPGLDQIAFTVPSGVTGCNVPVAVQTGNTVSNFVSMAIGSGGSCSTPSTNSTAFTPTQITTIQQKGNASIGDIIFERATINLNVAGLPAGFTLPPTTAEVGAATFYSYSGVNFGPADYNTILTLLAQGSTGSPGCSLLYSSGSATTVPTTPTNPVTTPVTPNPGTGTTVPTVVTTALDAGTPLTLMGPGGTRTMPKVQTGLYTGTLTTGTTPYLSAGSYTLTSPGGKDIGPINTSFKLPAPLTWTNAASVSTINRANGQTITWTGGDPAGTVQITGSSVVVSGTSSSTALFTCNAPVSAGQFTIPPVVLLPLPATPAGGLTSVSSGTIGIYSFSTPTTFTVPGIDLGLVYFIDSITQNVTFQ